MVEINLWKEWAEGSRETKARFEALIKDSKATLIEAITRGDLVKRKTWEIILESEEELLRQCNAQLKREEEMAVLSDAFNLAQKHDYKEPTESPTLDGF
jgi:hypothetical protein